MSLYGSPKQVCLCVFFFRVFIKSQIVELLRNIIAYWLIRNWRIYQTSKSKASSKWSIKWNPPLPPTKIIHFGLLLSSFVRHAHHGRIQQVNVDNNNVTLYNNGLHSSICLITVPERSLSKKFKDNDDLSVSISKINLGIRKVNDLEMLR